MKHPILTRSVSLLLALVMLLAFPAAALEQADVSGEAPGTAAEASEQTAGQDQEAEPYLDEDGNFNAPKKLTVYYTARLDGSETADMMPVSTYTGVAAFFDYAQDEELETPYFFYYENGRLQDDEACTVQSSAYLKLTAPHEEAEDAYYAEEVYVDGESDEPATYTFSFNRADGGENGPVLQEEPSDSALSDGAEPQTQEEPTPNTLTSEPEAQEESAAAPSGLTLSQEEDGSTPTLSWSAVSGAERYHIYRRTNGGAWAELARTEDTSYTDKSTLASGVTYTYDVRAAYDGGELSPEGESTVSYRLHPVPTVTLKSIAGGMRVTWTRDSAATGYRVYRNAGSGWQAVADLEASVSTYLDEGAKNNQKNAYCVRAYYGEAGLSGREDLTENVWSGFKSAELYYLTAPALRNVSTGNSGMNVQWTKVDGAVNYSVWRKTSPASSWTRLGHTSSTSFTDKTAKEGTAYYYTVVAHASAGSSHFYENATGYVLHGAPVVTAGRKGAGVSVKWTLDPDATGYFIFRRVGSTWKQIARAEAGVSSYQDDEPTVGTNYYTVRAYYGDLPIGEASLNGSNDWGAYKSSAGCVYYAVPHLGTPYNTDTGITVTWQKTSGAAGYTVFRKTESTAWKQIKRIHNGSTTSYLDTTAAEGVDYYYTVCAFYEAGGKQQGGFETPEESVRRYPDPTVSASAVSGGIKLTWKTDSSADGYRVWRKADGGGWIALTNLAAGTSSYLDTKVTGGARYTYTVRAYYGGSRPNSVSYNAASGLWSGGTRFGSVCYLDTPEIGAIRSVGNGVEVNWTTVSGATGYVVYRRTSPSSNWSWKATLTGQQISSYVDTAVSNNTTYYYTVRAFNKSASLNNWGDFERTAPGVVYHAAPTASITIVEGGFRLSWTKDAAATGYRIYRQTGSTGTMTLMANCSAGTTSYTDTSVASNTTYSYRVLAYYGSGAIASASESESSDWSVCKDITYTYFDAPEMTSLVSSASGLKLTWKKVSGAAGYKVYRKTSATAAWREIATISSGATEAYVDTGSAKLASGTTVYYTVRATGADRVSMGDFDRNGQIGIYLATPELDNVKVSNSGASLTWKTVGGAQEYVIYRRTENGSWQRLSTSKSASYLDTSVKSNATNYFYTVRATCTATVDGRKINAMGYYDLDGVTFGIELGANGWVSRNGNTYYGENGYALTGWQYLSRNGGTYKYYFDLKTGALVTNLYSYFGKSYRELETKVTVNLTSQSSNPGQIAIYAYNGETKKFDIPLATFRCIGSLSTTFARGYSGYLRKGSSSRWISLTDGGQAEQYGTYIHGTPAWFHSALYHSRNIRNFYAYTYNSLISNNNSSLGCIRLQCIYAYLISDIMKNGYGKSHNVSVQLYKNNSSKGPFGVPQVKRISNSSKYDPTDPAITGKFFYDTTVLSVSSKAGADDWCSY